MKKYKIFWCMLMICLTGIFVSGCGRGVDTGKTGVENNISSESADGNVTLPNEMDFGVTREPEDKKNILIAYFSRTDENYGVGFIEKGNTEIIAEMIAQKTGGKLFHIKTEQAYPTDYSSCTAVAKREKEENARPELADDIDISDYDVIFLGYPIWWSDCPMAVYTFLEGHDFNGKTIIPFCTHEGSGMSGTETIIKDTCQGAEVTSGLAVKGTIAQSERDKAKESVQQWLENLGY